MKRLKKAPLILMLVFVMTLVTAVPAKAGMMTVDSDVVTVSKLPSGKAGGKITIKMTIKNAGGSAFDTIELYNLEDFVTNLESGVTGPGGITGEALYPFEAVSSAYEPKDIDIKPDSKKTVTVSYTLRRDLQPGYYPALFKITDVDGSTTDLGVNIWVDAAGTSTDKPEPEVSNSDYEISVGDGQFTPAGTFGNVLEFGVNFTNKGLKMMYDMRVDMQLDPDVAKFPFDINEGNYLRYMGDVESGKTVTAPYSMAVRTDARSGFYPIHYKVTYREESGGDFVEPVEKVYYVRITGKDGDSLSSDAGEQDRTKARIIVDSFKTEPEVIMAGQPFELRVSMKNASSNVSASNIMFTFASEEIEGTPVFVSESGSTSVVVNSLAPGANTELSMVLRPSPTAEQKSYRMTIQEQFDSPEFKNAKEEVKIAIPVKQEPRFNMSTIEVMPDSITVGSETNVMFGINNTGKVLLYNVMARFEGDTVATSESYVGNIKPGETGNVDAMVTGTAPTMDDGKVKIIVSYEDENGEKTEVEKEMILFVNEMNDEMDMMGGMDMGMGGMDGMEEPEPPVGIFGKIGKIVTAVLVLGAAAIAFVVIRKKKLKKAAEEAEEEECDDELS